MGETTLFLEKEENKKESAARGDTFRERNYLVFVNLNLNATLLRDYFR